MTAARKRQVDRESDKPRALAAWEILAPNAQELLRKIELLDRRQESQARDLVRHEREKQLRLAPQERRGTPGPPAGWRWIVLEEQGFIPSMRLLDVLRGLEWFGLVELRHTSTPAGGDSNSDTSASGPQQDGRRRSANGLAAVRLTRDGRKLVHLTIGLRDRRSLRPPDLLPGKLWRILLAVAEVELVGLPESDVPPGLGRQLTTAGRWSYLELRKASFLPEPEAPLHYFLTAAGKGHVVARASDYARQFPDLWMSDAALAGRTPMAPDLAELLRRLRADQEARRSGSD
ncbi:hypothetical protein [Micromonospora sp.]|uniref:hypothetical protein n=1 Tax=Micromonospora sp. TaxID=1876 RepID=UPI003B3A6A6A